MSRLVSNFSTRRVKAYTIRCFAWAILAVVARAAAGQPANSHAEFRFENVDDHSLKLWQGKQPILVYNFGEMKRPGAAAAGNRASYVHPIYGLNGEVLTDDFPKDHYHHHGLFWGWPHVTVGGKEYDFWKMHGTDIQFKRWSSKTTEQNVAFLGVENEWLVGDKPVVREEATLGVHSTAGDGRLIDIRLKWTALERPVTLVGAPGKSYGGLSLRFARRENTVITVPGGPTAEDLLMTHLPWADLSGSFPSARDTSGAALLVDPHHPDFPPEWMTRAYGLLAIGWPGVKPQTIETGKSITCNYVLWIHRGRASAVKIQSVYDARFSTHNKNR